VILSVNIDPAIATFTLQNHLNQIQEWTKIWKIKIIEAKSTQVNFSKHKQIDLKIKDMYWLIGRNSKLSLENKILLYKTIIKPIWTYGAEIWGCASKSNISIIQKISQRYYV
jgi:hypothetical protein